MRTTWRVKDRGLEDGYKGRPCELPEEMVPSVALRGRSEKAYLRCYAAGALMRARYREVRAEKERMAPPDGRLLRG